MFKESALANLIFSCLPIAMGLVMAILVPGAMKNPRGYASAALAFFAIGFASFAIAKIQSIRKGHLISFGSAQMLMWQKWAYRIGYLLMVIGVLATMALAVATRSNP